MNLEFYNQLVQTIDKKRVIKEEPMKKHTTFRVGGNAEYFVMPKNVEEVRAVLALCRQMEIPYYILGNGSNLLVSDKGYRGVIIQLY